MNQLNYLAIEYARAVLMREQAKVARQVKRARSKGVAATLTLMEWLQILNHYNYKCAFCEGRAETMEHIVPVSKGGGTERSNVAPCCKRCNDLHNEISLRLDGKRRDLERLWG